MQVDTEKFMKTGGENLRQTDEEKIGRYKYKIRWNRIDITRLKIFDVGWEINIDDKQDLHGTGENLIFDREVLHRGRHTEWREQKETENLDWSLQENLERT